MSSVVRKNAFQDDAREAKIRILFNLQEPENRSRHGTDAILKVGRKVVEFELKSTFDGRAITTARDVGFDHLNKWKGKHWIIGVYNNRGLSYCYYLPPVLMRIWIKEKKDYIGLDHRIADVLHRRLNLQDMFKLIDKKKIYSLEDAKRIQKKQLLEQEYKGRMDLGFGYSPEAMLKLIHDRVKYLLLRGYTLNNPHIPWTIVTQGHLIDKDHARRLRHLVANEI